MTGIFEFPLIDLVEYGKSRKRLPVGRPFATHIGSMANSVIHRYIREQELVGIRSCLRQQLRVLHWRSYLWIFPLSSSSFSDGTFELEDRTYILPNSIAATVLLYRAQLDEHASGLSRLVFRDLVNGLEWACHSSLFQAKPEAADAVKLIARDQVENLLN